MRKALCDKEAAAGEDRRQLRQLLKKTGTGANSGGRDLQIKGGGGGERTIAFCNSLGGGIKRSLWSVGQRLAQMGFLSAESSKRAVRAPATKKGKQPKKGPSPTPQKGF